MSNSTSEEIYKNHGCSHYHIQREGMWDEYLRHGGNNKEFEKTWRAEYIGHWYDQIQSDSRQAFFRLGIVGAVEILDQLLEHSEFEDDYERFWYAVMLLDISKEIRFNPFKKVKVIKRARGLLEDLVQQEIHLTGKNKTAITKQMRVHLKANTAEEYIRDYSQDLLSKNK